MYRSATPPFDIVKGSANRVKNVGYVAVLTREEEQLEDEITNGWRVIDIARRES